MRASVARRCASELVFEATPHESLSSRLLPLSFLVPSSSSSSSSSSYLIQIHSAAARLPGERRLREPHAADRRGESTQAPTDEADPGGVDSSPPPTGADRKEPKPGNDPHSGETRAAVAVRVAFGRLRRATRWRFRGGEVWGGGVKRDVGVYLAPSPG